jgi:hypothetical protein
LLVVAEVVVMQQEVVEQGDFAQPLAQLVAVVL